MEGLGSLEHGLGQDSWAPPASEALSIKSPWSCLCPVPLRQEPKVEALN